MSTSSFKVIFECIQCILYMYHVQIVYCMYIVHVSLPWGFPVGGAQLLRQGFDFVHQRRCKAENATNTSEVEHLYLNIKMRDATCKIRASLAASSSSNSFLRFSSTFISVSVVTNCLERIFSVLIWTQNHKKRWLREGPKKIVFFGTLSQTSDPTHPPRTFGTPLSEKWKLGLFFFLGCLGHFVFF